MQDDLSVAPGALAGIRDRPLLLKHFVDGAEGQAFQKRAPAKRPLWLRTIALSFPAGCKAEEVVVDVAASKLVSGFACLIFPRSSLAKTHAKVSQGYSIQ